MDSFWMLNELGKARYEEFLQDASRARRFLSAKKQRQLSGLVQSLMLIFG
jgi:hypothetical protein